MGIYTANLNLYKPDIGEYGGGALVNANMDVLDVAALSRGIGCTLTNAEGDTGALVMAFGSIAADTVSTLWVEKTINACSIDSNSPGAMCVVTKKTGHVIGTGEGGEYYGLCNFQTYMDVTGGGGTNIGIDSYVRVTAASQPTLPSFIGCHGAWLRTQADNALDGVFIGCEVNPGSKDFGWGKETVSGYGNCVMGFVAAAVMGHGSSAFWVETGGHELITPFGDKYRWHTGLHITGDSILPTTSLWSSGVTYEVGRFVKHVVGSDLNVYRSLQADNLNKDPNIETTWWAFETVANNAENENEAIYIQGAETVGKAYSGIRFYNYLISGIDFFSAIISNEAFKFNEGANIARFYDSSSGGAYLTGNKSGFLLKESHLGFDNNNPIYWGRESDGTLLNIFNVNTSDELVIGNDLASGKIRININGTNKLLSIDENGFVKAA